jgi:hypothetical protein
VAKIFNNYQGESIRINGECYKFNGETVKVANSDPSEIEETYASCLACELDESSSLSESSESIDNFSTQSFSESSESELNESSESSEGVHINNCVGPCDLTVEFLTYTIPDGLQVYDNTGLVLDTGPISTGSSYNTYSFTDLECPVRICVQAPLSGTGWRLRANGCGMKIDTSGGQVVERCFESPSLWSSSSQSVSSDSSLSLSSDSSQSESSSSEPGGGPAYAGTKPAVNVTLTFASGPYTFMGENWGVGETGTSA